jgi:hypothetical protein
MHGQADTGIPLDTVDKIEDCAGCRIPGAQAAQRRLTNNNDPASSRPQGRLFM